MILRRSILALTAAFAIGCSAAAAEEVLIFAAASTGDAMTEAASLFEERTGNTVRASFASSSTLARQIEQGAPAGVFLSANDKWMDRLAARNLIVADTRTDLLRNRLVLVAPAAPQPPAPVTIAQGFPLARLLGDGRLAVGDPDHVPAGQYAKAALRNLGVWGDVEPRLARASDVRGALALAERGEVPYAIVYATDAAASAKVEVVATFPAESHPPVSYPVAVVAGNDSPTARAFVEFLGSPEARTIFERHGFAVAD